MRAKVNNTNYNVQYNPLEVGDFIVGLKSLEIGFPEKIEFFVLEKEFIEDKKTLFGTLKFRNYKVFSMQEGTFTINSRNLKVLRLIRS